MGLKGVPTKENDVVVIVWTLIMQECGLSILLHILVVKVVKLT
jgi:hypothetical protein